ncbi:flagellar filament capping protein FliD [Shewanella zhangzhouensis]|uniref:flagellar filament capping protein FliD n=1 Tax=Shewanella zhangzhouensis TaxID=2864213 RepID=UPI001C65CEE8|nr:flagellar filament capping protein FliD [Shewanella zhangzhouensis]QYK03965.1 flagellar filament capping protein FliD [Shewanella zhangzhouensis]
MALTATGIGSNLPINDMVSAIVNAEKTPKEALFNRTEDTINAKVSAIGTLKSELAKFQDALKKLQKGSELSIRKVTTGDSLFFKATADKFAQSGTYSIKVEQLAFSHKVAGTNTAAATDTVGEGRLDFTVNGESFGVDVDAADDLNAIAKKINDASDNKGVIATVITSDAGSRLVFSSEETGTANQVSVTATDTSGTGLNDMFNGANLSELQAAQDAILYVDNQKITSSSNEVKGAITGVTLELTKADIGEVGTLTISQDDEAVKANVTGFVDAYNALLDSINKLSSYDADNKKAAALQGDSMIRSLESQLRKMISERVDVNGETVALYDMGIKTDRYGKLEIDSAKLDKAIAEDMSSLEGLFSTTDTGLANRLSDLASTYTKAGGVISTRNDTYNSEKQRLDDQREAFTRKMDALEARLFKQFNAMDLVVASLNQQTTGLIDRLNSLPGVIKG